MRLQGGWAIAATGLVVALICLAILFVPGNAATVVIGVAGLAVSAASLVLTFSRGRRADFERAPEESLAATADILAMTVRRQWENEERIRRVHDPFPLPVRWVNAADAADHWENVHGSPDRHEPIDLAGRIDEIAAVFDRVPSGRLVVLGRAGAGKTVLTTRFVRHRLAARVAGDPAPVPVVFSLGTWDPLGSGLRDWLVGELLLQQPALIARHSTGVTIAAALVSDNRVLPVLDGFDEMPPRLRGPALRGINADLGEAMGVVLTSRPDEYREAVAAADVLTGAAVVEIADLGIEEVAEYLMLACGTTAGAKWAPVLDELRSGANPAAAGALSTPLMVSLARTAYGGTGADPAELLKPSAGEVDDLLFAGFVPSVYRTGRRDPVRWLGFAARHFAEGEVGDLAWWRLIDRVPRTVRAAAGAAMAFFAIAVAVLSTAWLPEWTSGKRDLWITAGLAFALFGAVVTGVVTGLGHSVTRPPEPSRIRLRGKRISARRDGRWRLGMWGALWVAGGLVFGGAASVVGLPAGLWVALGSGLVVGAAGWVVLGLVSRLAAPLEPTETVSPGHLLGVERRTTLTRAAVFGVVAGAVVTAVELGAVGQLYRLFTVDRLDVALLFGVTVIDGVVTWVFFFTAWGRWVLARTWFALRGQLPWRLPEFLADAHLRGVLRQAGGVYQFRHARLREHLAGHRR